MHKMIIFLWGLLTTLACVQPEAAMAQDVYLSIDWDSVVKTVPENAYGVNSPANFIPAYSTDATFMANLALITQKKGLIRLHGWGMIDESSPESWLTDGAWDAVKIQQALTPLVEEGYEIMINIPSGAMGEDDYQNAQAFAQFCADLVQIVNGDYQLHVKYWEIPNEREADFIAPGLNVSEMSNLIQQASQAMKNVDPDIKVGGAATAWVNVGYLTQLVQLTPEMDFISCHTYAGDCTNSLQEIYNNAQDAIADLALLRQNIDAVSGVNNLPIFLTEYNLSYQGCSAIQSYRGAVYDAMILTESVKSGIEASCYWNVAPYSDMSIIVDDNLDENAYLYEVMNIYFYGDLVQNSSSDQSKVLIFAVKNSSTNVYSFCLINRTNAVQHVALQMNGILPEHLDRYLWDVDHAYLADSIIWSDLNNGNFSLSPYSVNIFTGQMNPSGTEQLAGVGYSLFPNPTSAGLFLTGDVEKCKFQIFSSTGKLLSLGMVLNHQIDLTAYPAGVYFLRLYRGEEYLGVSKIIKN